MTIDKYILQCKQNLSKLETIEEYEKCQEMHDLISSLENKDVEKYIYLTFDIKGLEKEGFLKKKATTV